MTTTRAAAVGLDFRCYVGHLSCRCCSAVSSSLPSHPSRSAGLIAAAQRTHLINIMLPDDDKFGWVWCLPVLPPGACGLPGMHHKPSAPHSSFYRPLNGHFGTRSASVVACGRYGYGRARSRSIPMLAAAWQAAAAGRGGRLSTGSGCSSTTWGLRASGQLAFPADQPLTMKTHLRYGDAIVLHFRAWKLLFDGPHGLLAASFAG